MSAPKSKSKRDHWTNNFGFVMAAAGAAIGLGNIWRFPYVCGENGGGAFLIAYIFCVFLIGMPIVWAELVIGRSSGHGSGGAFKKLAKKHKKFWNIVGLLGVVIAFIVASYYTIVAGWTLEYLFQSFQGNLADFNGQTSEAYFKDFMASDSRQIYWHLVFTVITVVILFGGISGGIEKVTEVLMPILLFLLVGLAVVAINIESAALGDKIKSLDFLFRPDWSSFTAKSFFHALGQAAFSLSIAVGTMVAYGSYLDKKESIPKLGTIVVIMDTMVAILGGLVIFPIVFSFGLNPEEGTGLVFVTLPALFAKMPVGYIIGPAFYILLFFAALTSSISLLEPVITHFVDEMKKSRRWACLASGIASALAGILWIKINSLETNSLFTNVDKLVSDLLIPIEAIAIGVFVGWAIDKKVLKSELSQAPGLVFAAWRFIAKWVCPIAVLIILIRGLSIF